MATIERELLLHKFKMPILSSWIDWGYNGNCGVMTLMQVRNVMMLGIVNGLERLCACVLASPDLVQWDGSRVDGGRPGTENVGVSGVDCANAH